MAPGIQLKDLRESSIWGRSGSRTSEDRKSRSDLLKWLLLIPLVLLIIFGCGSLALIQTSPAQADTRSHISADYQPWEFTVFKPLDEEILEEIQEDQQLYGETFTEPVQPIVVAGSFWEPTETPLPGTPTPTPTLAPSSTASLTPTDLTPTSTVTISLTPSSTPTPTLSGPPPAVPPASPPGNTYWFQKGTNPLTHMMYTTLPNGVHSSGSSPSFHSPAFSLGQSLQAGTTTVNFYATNPSSLASIFSVKLSAGGTQLGFGSFALPANTYDAFFFSASIATGQFDFADGDRLELNISFGGSGEIYWDGPYNYSGAAVPAVINLTSTPTASPSPTITASPTSTGTVTNTPVPTNTPTNTATNTATNTPTNTATNTPTNTATFTPTNTATNTPVPPTNTPTNTPVPPTNTPTNTPVPPTNTPTNTPVPPTNTPTNTPVPPTNTPTNTPVPPTNTPTNTPVPPTSTPTNTPVPPTNTPTNTPLPPTPTPTPTGAPSWWNCSYLYRDPTTITIGSAAVPSGYSVSLNFNHAALVTGGKSLANGNDIRVLYWNGLSWVELDRFLDPGSTWNSASTTIWFQTQAAIVASSSDADYYIYYGNTGAGAPPANPSNIFFFHDGYESGDYTGWGGVSAGPGDANNITTSTVHTGTYAAESVVDGDPITGSFARVENNFSGQSAFHSTVWVYLPLTYNATDDITVLQFYTGGWTTKVGSLSIRAPLADLRPFIANFNPSPAEYYFSATPLTLGVWHRLEMKIDVASGRAEVWQDGVKTVNETGRDFGAGNIDHTLENIFWKSAGSGPETMYFDDSFDKTWVDPEPTTALGGEQASTCPPTPTPTPTSVPGGGKLYWADTAANKIQRSNLDGSNIEDVVTFIDDGVDNPYGIDLDTVNGKIYWVDQATLKIQRANLDGSTVEDLITTGLISPEFVAVDPAGGKMYWTDQGTDKIQRANLDGTGVEDLITTGLTGPEDIQLDIGAGKMYWVDWSSGEINRANLDGTGVENLVSGLTNPNGMALDLITGKMYWVDDSDGLIQRANLDGTGIENLTPPGVGGPKDIDLDVAAGYMYWTESALDRVRRANLDGSGDVEIITGLGNVRGVAVDPN